MLTPVVLFPLLAAQWLEQNSNIYGIGMHAQAWASILLCSVLIKDLEISKFWGPFWWQWAFSSPSRLHCLYYGFTSHADHRLPHTFQLLVAELLAGAGNWGKWLMGEGSFCACVKWVSCNSLDDADQHQKLSRSQSYAMITLLSLLGSLLSLSIFLYVGEVLRENQECILVLNLVVGMHAMIFIAPLD